MISIRRIPWSWSFPPAAAATAKMFRADLEAAGIAYIDEAGRYADLSPLTATHGRDAVGKQRRSPEGCAITYEAQ
jgi:hypothetical protein